MNESGIDRRIIWFKQVSNPSNCKRLQVKVKETAAIGSVKKPTWMQSSCKLISTMDGDQIEPQGQWHAIYNAMKTYAIYATFKLSSALRSAKASYTDNKRLATEFS